MRMFFINILLLFTEFSHKANFDFEKASKALILCVAICARLMPSCIAMFAPSPPRMGVA